MPGYYWLHVSARDGLFETQIDGSSVEILGRNNEIVFEDILISGAVPPKSPTVKYNYTSKAAKSPFVHDLEPYYGSLGAMAAKFRCYLFICSKQSFKSRSLW